MSELQITSEQTGAALVLRLEGEPTIMTADQLDRAFTRAIAARPTLLIVDLSGVTGISSLMAGQLIGLQNGLKRHEGRAAIAGPSQLVRTALDRMRIGSVLPIFKSVEDALRQQVQSG